MDALSSKSKSVDIQILDYKQCVDAMWLEKTLNDIYEGGIRDDNLALLYEANKKVKVAIKTPHGLTERRDIEKIIMQGDVFGPIQCSLSVDTFGKECLREEKHLYAYKGEVGVPPLAMVDDLLLVTECGYKATMANAYINTKSNLKKLQFGTDKCHKMHVGKTKIEEICPDLFVDEWKMNEVSEVETGESILEDEHAGLTKMKEVIDEKYLGDILSSDGKNMKNVLARVNRGVGIANQIISMLEEICFGNYYFQVAVILRNSLFISSVLCNSEAWYNITAEERDKLEQADEMLLRRILECPSSTPKEMLYLELNCLPIRFIIMSRRLNYLSSILREDKSSLIFRFLQAQLKNPTKNDWGQTVISDLKAIGFEQKLSEIVDITCETFKNVIQVGILKVALAYLNSEKSKHSKVLHISHTSMEMQDYLCPNEMSVQEAKFVFQLRSRMVEVRTNYGGSHPDLRCPLCMMEHDTQKHLLECVKLDGVGELVSVLPEYEDLFSRKLEPKVKVSRILRARFLKRKQMMKKESQKAQVIQ